ncbi:MAG: hypothetical protein JXP73_16450 [Deltaproteobacteria bacterium]|nr:hypothetical protein [Deltaproteobacteria bacterium]
MFLPLHLRTAVAAFVLAAPAVDAAAPPAIGQAAVDRMIDLNRKAYADIRHERFAEAKHWLAEALVIGETEGLDHDEMTARTHIHLAAVSLAGFGDREEAVRQFVLALRINANISITSGLETPALKSAYLQAREQLELPPNPDTTVATSPPRKGKTAAAKPSASTSPVPVATPDLGDALDPDPPARVPSPLYCPLPFEISAGQDLVVRCLTQRHQKRTSATLNYRAKTTSAEYVTLPMAHSPKGWLIAVIPGHEIRGKSLSYYVKAHLPGTKTALFNGYPEAPNALLVRDPSSEERPMSAADSSRAQAPCKNGRNDGHWHRRTPGAVWLTLAAGAGAVYHGREAVDSNTRTLATGNPLYVEAGFSPATMFQFEPEIGYQLSRRFSVSAMLRYQYAPLDGTFVPEPTQNAVLTSAFAGFLRTQFLLGSSGNFQGYVSGGAGLGTSFLAIISKRCDANLCALDHSDTLHGGKVGLTVGLALVYRFLPDFGLLLDFKEIMTLPKVMALTEFNVGLEFAHNFLAGAAPENAKAGTLTASR